MRFYILYFSKCLKMKWFLCILFFFIIINTSPSYAQNNCQCNERVDSKVKELRDSLNTFNISTKLKNTLSKGCHYQALTLEFKYYSKEKQFKKASKILNDQEKLLGELECKEQLRYSFFENNSTYYRAINDLENLSDYAFKTLSEAEKLDDKTKEINALQNIVFVFTRLNEDEKNWNYIKRAEQLILGLKSSPETVKYYRWLALEHENKYTLTQRKTLIDTALIFINKARKLAMQYKLTDELSESYKVLEACSYHRKEFNKAVMYIDSSIYYAKKSKSGLNLGPLYIYKSWDLLELEEFSEVEKSLDSAVKYDQSEGAAKMSFFYEASNIYEGIGNIENALINYKKYAKLKDSILNIQTLEKVNDIEQKYNKVANENTIVQLEKTKQFYLSLILGSLLTILVLILFFRQRSLKNKQKIMLTEQRLNKARINPHFFFNSMASLQSLSLKEESPKTARFISRFAKIMRQSLENTYDDAITLEDEIDFLTQYLEVQKLRYPHKFEYKFFIDDGLEIDELKIPSMIIQPFVENAIEHGFKNIEQGGLLELIFNDKNENFQIVIKDNGGGQTLGKHDKEHKSRAMQIITDRLYLFNKQHKSKAHYKIKPIIDAIGFEIEIILPKLYNA